MDTTTATPAITPDDLATATGRLALLAMVSSWRRNDGDWRYRHLPRHSRPNAAELAAFGREWERRYNPRIGTNLDDATAVLVACDVAARIKAQLRALALTNGVADRGYDTVRSGWVDRYVGTAEFPYLDGRVRAVGYGPDGDEQFIVREGGLRFRLVTAEAER